MNTSNINWRRNAVILALVEFQIRSMMMIIRPYISLYLPELGITEAADIVYWTGLLTSIQFISQAIASPFWGNLADRIGRKSMVMRCVIGMGIFALMLPYAQNVYQFLVIRFLMGAVSGFNAAATTLVATNTPEEHMGYSIGLIQTGYMAGTIAGPAVGAVVAELVGYRGSFTFSGISILLLIPVVLFGVKENFVQVKMDKKKQAITKTININYLKNYKTLTGLIMIIFITQFSIQGNDAFIPLLVQEIYQGERLNTMVAIAFGASAIAAVVTTPLLGKFGDKWGNFKVVTICLWGFGVGIILQSFITNVILLGLIRVVTGIFIGGIIPNTYTSISKLSSQEVRGSILGITASVVAIGSFAGPLINGVIAARFGLSAIFLSISILLFVGAFLSTVYSKWGLLGKQEKQLTEI